MHQRKDKKILIYFFLLLLFGSINNITFNALKFNKVNNISVIGLENYDNLVLLKKIENLSLSNIFSINKDKIDNQISSNSLVEKYNIFKRYPSSLDIRIQKTKFVARINKDGKIFLLGTNGKLSDNNFSNNHLPFIFGKLDIDEFLNFKRIIDQSKFSYDEIKNLFFFSSKRWDLELKNNLIIKLSNNNAKESLKLVYDFLNNRDFGDIKIVDARIKNQIILND